MNPLMGRPHFSAAERQAVFSKPRPNHHPHPAGTCFHCGKLIAIDNFHVDHFPIQYADIENQICCGVTDPKDITNLVPSCPSCNLSHRFETKKWCGHSQIPITKLCLFQLYSFLCTVLFLVSLLVCYYLH